MKIRKSQLRQAVNETVQAFFVTPQSMGMVGVRGNAEGGASQLEEDDIDKNELKNIIGQIVDDVQNAATSRMQSGAGGRVDHTGKLTEAGRLPIQRGNRAKWYDAIKRPVKVGDRVHVGHKQKGGAGVEGIVTKINKDGTIELRGTGSEKHRTFRGKLKNTAILEISGVDSLKPNDPRTPGADDVERDAADDVMEADPKEKGGRPRGAPHIQNVRFWDLPESSLRYIINDASDAVKRLPMAKKAGKWADEVNDAVTVLHWRKKKGIKIKEELPLYSDYAKQHKESFNAAPYGQGKKQASVIGTNEAPEVGSLAKGKRKEIVQKMHKLVKDGLGFKSIENVQPIDPKGVHGDDGVAFIFGDAKEGRRFANYLKKQRSLGKVVKMRGDRLMVSMYY